MQMVGRDDIDQVLGQQASIIVRLQIVGGAIELRPASDRIEVSGRRIELPSGEKLQRQEGVSRSHDTQIDFPRMDLPFVRPVAARHEEVHAEPTDDAVCGEYFAYPDRRVGARTIDPPTHRLSYETSSSTILNSGT
jgi:hypothetical protein